MLRLCTELESPEILDSLCARYNAQHFNLRRFYYECSNLKYLTGLINVPKLGQVGLVHVIMSSQS